MKKSLAIVMVLVFLLLLCDCSKSNEQPVNTVHENRTEQSTIPQNDNITNNKKGPQTVFTSSQIKDSYIGDLVYHLFSYMDIGGGNPANVYSRDYIAKIAKVKKEYGIKDTLEEDLKKLTEVFVKRYPSLEKIMFIPFYVKDYDEFKSEVLKSGQFPDEDARDFVQPFLKTMEKEQDFYYSYWNKKIKSDEQNRSEYITYLNNQFAPIKGILEYKKMKPEIYLCYSMSKNGRGFDKNGTKGVAVLSPASKEQRIHIFLHCMN
jgi:hypothetical protein